MAGIRGNVGYILAAKQTAKGTPAVPTNANAFKNPLSGGNIAPVRETDNLTETDASRDRGITYVTTSGVEGSPEMYVRDDSAGFWLAAGLGGAAAAGSAPDFTHTITGANALPYITVWRNVGDTLYERFDDCMVGSLNISASAGEPLTLTAGIQGLNATRLTAAPDTPTIPVQAGAVYNFNEATVTLGGTTTALVSSFEFSLENNVTRQQTDSVVPQDVYAGTREVTLSFDMIFENLTEYNKFHYGGASGTQVASDVYTTSAAFEFNKGALRGLKFEFPSIAYTEFPVEVQPSGDAITVSVSATAQRNPSGVVTVTVKNGTAAY